MSKGLEKNSKIISIIFLLIMCGCTPKEKIVTDKALTSDGKMSLIFDFPDTVFVNKDYNGTIIYKNILDTITADLSNSKDSIRNRYISYSMIISNNVKNIDSLRHITTDTFAAIDNRTIPLFKLRFKRLGVQYIDGLIIDNGYIQSNVQDSVRIITNEFRVTHKVFVKKKINN